LPQSILLRGAKQLLTLRGPAGPRSLPALRDLAIIEDGSLLIRDGKIVQVGTTRRIENLKESRDALEISALGRVVMPGLIDPSVHVTSAHASGASKRKRTPAEFQAAAIELIRSCLHHGTLTAELKGSAGASDFHSDLAVLRQLAKIAGRSPGIINTWRVDGAAIATHPDFFETLATVARRKLAQFIKLDLRPASIPPPAVFEAIENSRLPLKLSWTGGDHTALSDLLARLKPEAVFCPQPLSPEECRALAASSAIAVFSPGENALEDYHSDSPRDVADAGGAIALSSGYDARHAPSFSMQMVIALAVFRLRLTPEEAISAATINAAYASGRGTTTGSLEVGKQANLLLLDISDYRDLPRQFGVNHVSLAMRDGAVLFNRNRWKAGAA
jgi:imidazolonepropionase